LLDQNKEKAILLIFVPPKQRKSPTSKLIQILYLIHVFGCLNPTLFMCFGCQFSYCNLNMVANFPSTIWLPIFLLQLEYSLPTKIDDGEKLIAINSPLLNNYLSSHYSPFQTQIAGYSPPIETTHGYHLSEIYRL
jgi:hypothetical protein